VANTTTPQTDPAYDRLIVQMEQIAEAVNRFQSAELQRAAFDAIVGTIGIKTAQVPTAPPSLTVVSDTDENSAPERGTRSTESADPRPPAAAKPARSRKTSGKRSFTIDKEINFRPAGKKSLRDFAGEKNPSTIEQKNVVIVYYIQEVLGLSSANIGQVLAGYQACQWKPAGSPDVSLRKTASRHGWLDTGNSNAITLTHNGRTFVEFDMPPQKAAPA